VSTVSEKNKAKHPQFAPRKTTDVADCDRAKIRGRENAKTFEAKAIRSKITRSFISVPMDFSRRAKMKAAISVCVLCLAGVCGAQTQPALCPRHIETPVYPQIARMAQLSGKILLAVTIDADGKVQDARVASSETSETFVKLVGSSAINNVRHWTFAKPPTAPYTETLVYDYQIDRRTSGGGTTVSFDLPERVTILSDLPILSTTQSKKH
jgi:TonB family protein